MRVGGGSYKKNVHTNILLIVLLSRVTKTKAYLPLLRIAVTVGKPLWGILNVLGIRYSTILISWSVIGRLVLGLKPN